MVASTWLIFGLRRDSHTWLHKTGVVVLRGPTLTPPTRIVEHRRCSAIIYGNRRGKRLLGKGADVLSWASAASMTRPLLFARRGLVFCFEAGF